MTEARTPVEQCRFSVVIPTHGRPDALRRAVDSVLAQTITDLEVIVVDDAGVPSAPVFQDARVTVLRQPLNGGVSAARNRGAEAARAEWIAFLDDDDLWYPRRLEAISAVLEEIDGERHTIVTTDLEVQDDGHVTHLYSQERPFEAEDQLLQSILRPFLTVMFVVHADLLREVGGFDEQLRSAEDADLLSRLLLAGGRVHLVDEPLARYNRGDGRTRDRALTWVGKLLWLEKLAQRDDLGPREAEAVAQTLVDTRLRLLRLRAIHAVDADDSRRPFLAAAATLSGLSWRIRLLLVARAVLPERWFARLPRSGRTA